VQADAIPIRAESAPTADAQRGPAAGLTVRDVTWGSVVREVARRLRVSEDKIRHWIARGELKAINTATDMCGKPRWVITPEALADFEKKRAGGPAPKPQRRRRQPAVIDFFPD
jgi:hypothetical protein